MGRREQREHIFKLLFMTQFNAEGDMPEQLSLYFDSLGDLAERIRRKSRRNMTVSWNSWRRSTGS